ncbi:MAG: glycoside hydrolase family 71/99-like protein [Anaerolineae bacterium]
MARYGSLAGLFCLMLSSLLAGCAEASLTPTASPEVSTATPEAAPPTQTAAAPPTEAAEPQHPLLMAHYMPWYQTPEVSGYWGWHWTMDHFDPRQEDDAGRAEIASHYYPLTGPYDSRDRLILEYQTLLMKVSGIDGVIVDWYGIEDFWDYGVINASTHRLFDAVAEAGLRFAICYEDQTIKHMVDNNHLSVEVAHDHGQEVMTYLQEIWFGTEPYLKADGRPVLLVFGPQYFKSVSDWDTLFSVLEERPVFITLDGHTEAAATSTFPWPPMWASTNGVLTRERLDQYLTAFYRKAERWDYRVAGAFPGFHDIYEEAGVGDSYGYLDPAEGETFGATLQAALSQDPDVIQLVTWNDYGEGTIIEPTVEFGYRYLEQVQETRRATDDEDFPFDAEDLRLPLQLLEARRNYASDPSANARLDEAFSAMISGKPREAATILADYVETP